MLLLALALLTGAFSAATHHHEGADPGRAHDACSLCVVGKLAAAPPPSPLRLAVVAVPSRIESAAPALAPRAPRLALPESRGPPRG